MEEGNEMCIRDRAYWVMKNLLGLDNGQMAEIFADWNEGKLRSYLIEITGTGRTNPLAARDVYKRQISNRR